MAFSLNKMMLIGNLGQDAENKFTTTNVSVTTYSVATNNSYKGKDGQWVNEVTWHNVVSYNLPEFLKEGLKKGKKVYVEGRLSKRKYKNKQDQEIHVTEVISEKVIPLDSKDSGYNTDSDRETNSGSNNYEPDVNDNSSDTDDLPF
ncbi:MAG: single-stranded DNA-binding protein [Melioribacteraceae bacterium]|nr:single-stranded DNA-binding protein [Melioribacteraceae bacterium]